MEPGMGLPSSSSSPPRAKRLSRWFVALIVVGALVVFGALPSLLFARCQTASDGVVARVSNWILPVAFGCGGSYGGPSTYTLSVSKAGSGLVSSSPSGIDCGTTCDAEYVSGTSVSLTATPAIGYAFTGWSGACTGTAGCTLTMDSPKSVGATFTQNFHTLTLTVVGSGGNINNVVTYPGGNSCTGVCVYTYPEGSEWMLVQNMSQAGWVFNGWSGDCTVSPGGGECFVTMNSDKSVTATFAPTLTVSLTGSGGVTSSPAGINCGTTCSSAFPYQSSVTLTATPTDSHSDFTGWSGACTGTGGCTLTMDGPKSVTATFTYRYVLVFETLPQGVWNPGYVTINGDPNWNCSNPGGCQPWYPPGTVVTIVLNPPAGWRVAGWGGVCSGSGTATNCTFVMDANKYASATFSPTLNVSLTGSGTVTSSPAGIDCGATCSAPFPVGSSVTLTATPNSGYVFTGWSGACTGTAGCTLTMDSPKSVGATFTQNLYTLTLSVLQNGGSGNYVAIYPFGDACLGDGSGRVCVRTYPDGQELTLSVNGMNPGYAFAWSGDCTVSPTQWWICTLTMNADKAVTATFSPTVTVSVTGNGSVTSTPAGIDCGATCNAPFSYNSSVTLTATPDAGNVFTGWSGACTGTGGCTLTMDAPKSATATFVLQSGRTHKKL